MHTPRFFTLTAFCFIALAPPVLLRAAEPAKPAAPADAPAETVFKNIKVLSGMPAYQMIPVMHLMRSSLGVSCEFCHVTEGNRFDLDSKKEKQTAREMVKMMQEINRANFEGDTEVTCNSCHRGQPRPLAVPPIGPAAALPTPLSPQDRAALPTAVQVVDRYLEALGGRTALAAITSRISKGTILGPKWIEPATYKVVNRGQEDPLEIVQKAPNHWKATSGPAAARTVQTFDGTTGTLESPQGNRPLTPQELKSLALDADLQRDLKLRERADKMRVVGKDKIDGSEVYVVRAGFPDGRRQSLYFDVKTGLLVRRLLLNVTLLGSDPEQTDYADYRDVGGVKVPFVVKTSYLDDDHLGTTRKLTEVKNNP